MRTFRRIAILPLVTVALVSGAPHALAAADNAAVAINTKDDVYVSRQAFKITRVADDLVDESNGAAAVSSCERCRTAAVAFQVIIATGTASNVTSTNLAIALNQECLSCATYAGAFQLIVTPRTPMRFTEEGNERIDQIRAELQALLGAATFGPTFEEIDAFNAQVTALFEQLKTVVHTELVEAGGGSLTADVDIETV
jgi:putative peptide zinc metalloprotease protein